MCGTTPSETVTGEVSTSQGFDLFVELCAGNRESLVSGIAPTTSAKCHENSSGGVQGGGVKAW